MEHMKRMLTVAVAVILAGAALMYVHRNMYKNCSDDVAVQFQEQESGVYSQRSPQSVYSPTQSGPRYQRYQPGATE